MASTGERLPSFLPPDPKVEEPYLLMPRMAMRVAILGGIALIAFGVLFLRLWSLQILSAREVRNGRAQNQLRRDRIEEAPRGTIVDWNGRVLVRNVASTAVALARLPTSNWVAIHRCGSWGAFSTSPSGSSGERSARTRTTR